MVDILRLLVVRDDPRATFARSIDRLLDEAERPQPLLRSMRRLFRQNVAVACARPLMEIRGVLADDSATVRPEAMRRLRQFLTDGTRSPLYGDDVAQARRSARELAVAFAVPAHASGTRWR